MPKAKKSSPAKKAAPKKAKRASPPKPATKALPKASAFMWQLLKRKEAERANKQEDRKNGQGSLNQAEPVPIDSRNQRFSKFAGPRRRAA